MNPFGYQLLVPLGSLFAVGLMICEWSIGHVGIALCFWFLFGGVGVEIMLHRYYSHRSFRLGSVLERALTVLSVFGAQHSPIWWRALHVRRHLEADSKHDVHSPKDGFWHAFVGWHLDLDPNSVSLRCSAPLIRDDFHRFVHSRYYLLFWTPVILLAVVDFQLAYFVFVVPGFLAFMQTSLVNSICHLPQVGYRKFRDLR